MLYDAAMNLDDITWMLTSNDYNYNLLFMKKLKSKQ